MAFLIALIVSGIIFGCITKYISSSKGYDGGFWWGFFLGIVGILVVGFRPSIQQQNYTSYSETPKWATNNLTTPASWTCICGAKNSGTIDYCLACRRTKNEGNLPKKICPHCGAGNKATNTICFACDKPLDEKEQSNKSIVVTKNEEMKKDYVSVLEQLAKLHDQGILTDEEFQQKKSDILAKM